MLVKSFDLFSYLASYHFFCSSFLVRAAMLRGAFGVDGEVGRDWAGAGDFDNSFCIGCGHYCGGFFGGGWAPVSVSGQFWPFPKISWFSRILSLKQTVWLVFRQVVRHLVHCFYVRYQVPFYLRCIKTF